MAGSCVALRPLFHPLSNAASANVHSWRAETLSLYHPAGCSHANEHGRTIMVGPVLAAEPAIQSAVGESYTIDVATL
eukprot:4280344-Prymnesium_polylepis.1